MKKTFTLLHKRILKQTHRCTHEHTQSGECPEVLRKHQLRLKLRLRLRSFKESLRKFQGY